MKWDKVKDSGERSQFTTGAVRDTQTGKGRYDLLPMMMLRRLAIHLENGAIKYGDDNWRKGIPYKTYYNSAMRHMLKWFMGWKDEDHLAAAIWNLSCLLETEELVTRGKLPKSLDNRDPNILDDEMYENDAEVADINKDTNMVEVNTQSIYTVLTTENKRIQVSVSDLKNARYDNEQRVYVDSLPQHIQDMHKNVYLGFTGFKEYDVSNAMGYPNFRPVVSGQYNPLSEYDQFMEQQDNQEYYAKKIYKTK